MFCLLSLTDTGRYLNGPSIAFHLQPKSAIFTWAKGKNRITRNNNVKQLNTEDNMLDEIIKKIMKRSPKTTRNIKTPEKLRRISYGIRKIRAEAMKEQIEREDLERKFVMMNKYKISKEYDEIVKRMIKNFENNKKKMNDWVGLIFAAKIISKTRTKLMVLFGISILDSQERICHKNNKDF